MASRAHQPATYESLSIMAFVNEFLTIMALQMGAVRIKMSAHLQEMMEHGETIGWPVVSAYHVLCLYHLEQCRAMWNDEATWLKMCRALVWHRMAPSSQPSATPTTTTPQAPTRAPRRKGPFRLRAQPGDRCAYNQGLCTS